MRIGGGHEQPVILSDVNVLVHAFRSDSPEHEICRSWLDSIVNGEDAIWYVTAGIERCGSGHHASKGLRTTEQFG